MKNRTKANHDSFVKGVITIVFVLVICGLILLKELVVIQ